MVQTSRPWRHLQLVFRGLWNSDTRLTGQYHVYVCRCLLRVYIYMYMMYMRIQMFLEMLRWAHSKLPKTCNDSLSQKGIDLITIGQRTMYE